MSPAIGIAKLNHNFRTVSPVKRFPCSHISDIVRAQNQEMGIKWLHDPRLSRFLNFFMHVCVCVCARACARAHTHIWNDLNQLIKISDLNREFDKNFNC